MRGPESIGFATAPIAAIHNLMHNFVNGIPPATVRISSLSPERLGVSETTLDEAL